VAKSCNFDQCKFPKDEEEILPPAELLADYYKKRAALDHEIDRTLAEIERILGLNGSQASCLQNHYGSRASCMQNHYGSQASCLQNHLDSQVSSQQKSKTPTDQ
jgi:hypothetical protein